MQYILISPLKPVDGESIANTVDSAVVGARDGASSRVLVAAPLVSPTAVVGSVGDVVISESTDVERVASVGDGATLLSAGQAPVYGPRPANAAGHATASPPHTAPPALKQRPARKEPPIHL